MTYNPAQPTIALGAQPFAHVVERVRIALRAAFLSARRVARSLRRDREHFEAERSRIDSIAHLNVHVLKDIGAPHWVIARAASSRDEQSLRWTEIEMR
jgi:hypothetical protein